MVHRHAVARPQTDGLTSVRARTFGEVERDNIEGQIQEVMRAHFDGVHHFGSLGDVGTTSHRIDNAIQFLVRETGKLPRAVAEARKAGGR